MNQLSLGRLQIKTYIAFCASPAFRRMLSPNGEAAHYPPLTTMPSPNWSNPPLKPSNSHHHIWWQQKFHQLPMNCEDVHPFVCQSPRNRFHLMILHSVQRKGEKLVVHCLHTMQDFMNFNHVCHPPLAIFFLN